MMPKKPTKQAPPKDAFQSAVAVVDAITNQQKIKNPVVFVVDSPVRKRKNPKK